MENLFALLTTIPDHRSGNRLTYPLDYLLLISFSAIMSGFKTWSQFELYAELHEKDLKKLYEKLSKRELLSYTPSHDTFGYAFSALDPNVFKSAFSQWLTGIFDLTGQHICIDGKTMRGVKNLDPDSESHAVTAYVAGLRVSLNEVFISKKSNEINAIKDLLNIIDIEGSTVTIDAIGTQVEIVNQIVERKGDYVLNVKSNQQGTLLELEEHFKPFYKKEILKTESQSADHGRIETRSIESIIDPLRFSDIECYKSLNNWNKIKSIHKLTRVRYDKKSGVESKEVSYYISSLNDHCRVFDMIRSHWSVENNLHYCLDVFLGEDKSLIRKANAAKNVNIINKIALFFLERLRIKKKRTFDAYQKINALKEPSQILSVLY